MRVLLVSARMGGGHDATARSLAERAQLLWPGCEIGWVDTLDAMGPGVGPLFRWIYRTNVQTTPWLYEFFYAQLVGRRWFARASKRFVGAWAGRRLAREVAGFAPDLVASTYPLGTAGLEWLRRFRGVRIPTGAWISDFAPHPFWVHRDIDLHLVMHEVAVASVRAAEPLATVSVCAPPVVSAFDPGDPGQARRRLGLPTEGFLALVTTGEYSFGDVEGCVDALLDAGASVRVVVVCARDETLRRRLAARGVERLHAVGWVENMPEWMRAADVVVTNAGGATSLEALACARPVIMADPIAAHGRANAQLMAACGLALLCPRMGELTDTVRRLLANPAELQCLAAAARAHLRRHDRDAALLRLAATTPGDPRGQRVRAADALFLHVDTPTAAQNVGAVLLLDPRADGTLPTLADAQALIARRLPQLPALRRRLAPGSRRPRWQLLPDIDLGAHLSAGRLGHPGQLREETDRFFAAPLPRDRPLWRLRLLQGAGTDGRQAALLVALHHSVGDGVSVLNTLDGLLEEIGGTPARWPIARRPDTARPGRIAGARLLASGLWRLARAGRAPASPVDGPFVDGRRHVVLVELPAARLRRLAHLLGTPSSVIATSLVAGALHRLLDARGLPTEGVVHRVVAPHSLRPAAAEHGHGNWTGAARVDLPVGPMSERQRLALVRSALCAGAGGGAPRAAQAVVAAIGWAPPRLHAALARRVYGPTWFNLIVSYVPGRARRRSFAGAPIVRAHPVLPVTDGVGLAVGFMPWADQVGVSVTVDPTIVPDADDFADELVHCLAELDETPTGRVQVLPVPEPAAVGAAELRWPA